ncbi:lysylphosphatidylglycerol synthase transmembrane domain-containing protein [uncultured Bifidobacterium sp.]|uniref:lysylphosphatidylglycerol synthase transmembrane domain-containing protein n=1 Tax=uncultured Bifidobacterium sp. TaxID=165187 RepID=UPI0028DBB894|nr:lysylphosphatidylglycerol synthase transmembrane domain-containing protein [uncultured Bifidobacterium sp.]
MTDASSPDGGGKGTVAVTDTPPRRTRSLGDLVHAVFALVTGLLVLLSASMLHGVTSGVESDAHTVVRSIDWLMNMPASLLQQLTTLAIVVTVLVHMLMGRAWLQSAMSVIALFAGYAGAWGLSLLIARIGDAGLLASLTSVESGASTMLIPDIYAGVGAFLTVAGPRRTRSSVKWGWNGLMAIAAILVAVLWYSVAGTFVSFAIARLVGTLLRFATGTVSQGAWGDQIVQALRSIGLDPIRLVRRDEDSPTVLPPASPDDDLVEGSRLYDAETREGRRFVVSVLDGQAHVAGYLGQWWQWIRLSGIPVRRDRSVSDATHHHLAMLLGLENAGLRTPDPYGAADTGESSLLVLDASSAPIPCRAEDITDEDAYAFMDYLRTANSHGYTHRRITPDCLARLGDGTPVIAGWQNGDCASAGASVMLDRVQLILLMAALLGPDRAMSAARRVWSRHDLSTMSPFIQRAALPMATRSLEGCNRQLISEIRAETGSAEEDEAQTPQTVTLSRFSIRSFLTIALAVIAVAVVFTQLRPDEVIDAVRKAEPVWALVAVLCGMVAWAGSAVTLGAFVDHDERDWPSLTMTQVAAGFTAVSMPAGVGPAFVNLQYLRRRGLGNAEATAVTGATWGIQGLATIAITVVLGLFTGRSTLSGAIPTNTLVIVIGAIVLAFCLAMAVPPLRRLLTHRYLPLMASYAHRFMEVIARPDRLAAAGAGALVLNVATALGFWVCLLAFGCRTNPVETMFVFLLANTLASAVPTPGGLGAVEAALSLSFTGVGVPAGVALSATLLYRVVFYWLRIPLGAAAMRWLSSKDML